MTDSDMITRIVDRAMGMAVRYDIPMSRQQVALTMAVVHQKIPLRLQELSEADDFNFLHDVGGILRHFNSQTMKLENCFIPRFAA